MTLNDLERRNGPFALFHRIHVHCRLKTIIWPASGFRVSDEVIANYEVLRDVHGNQFLASMYGMHIGALANTTEPSVCGDPPSLK